MKGCKAKSAKGKGTQGEDQRKPGITFQQSSLSEVTQDVLISPARSYDNICEVSSTREAQQRLSAKGFYWRLVTQAMSAWLLSNPSLPERKYVFRIDHIVCTSNLGTVSHSLSWKVLYQYRELFTIQVPRQQLRASLVRGLF